jgi:hypothetical protein
MAYDVSHLTDAHDYSNLQSDIERTGFAKVCEHGHYMHTPNNAPLPAHTADYHSADRNGLGGYYPDPNGEEGQSDLRFDQFHEKDLTGRGYLGSDILQHLVRTRGNVSMCPHGAVITNDNGNRCRIGDHIPDYMLGVERNMSSSETVQALQSGNHQGGRWSDHPTWTRNNNSYDDDDASGWQSSWTNSPRSEQELIDQEPERVERIRERIGKVVALADNPRFANSSYTAHAFPSGSFYPEHRIDDKSPEQAEHEGLSAYHTVIGYHNGTAVGRLMYNSRGGVSGMYLDHRHQNGPVTIKMLAAAHEHLLSLGNPIGMLHSDSTTSNSAGLIKKIDPESTYLRQPSANTGWNEEYEWNPKYQDDQTHPFFPEHTERRSRQEWKHLSELTGLNINDLHAISPDETNRYKADLSTASNEAVDIHNAYKEQENAKIQRNILKLHKETRAQIPEQIAAFSRPAGYMGDTAALETQMPEAVSDLIGSPHPHVPAWRPRWNSAGLDTLSAVNSLQDAVNDTARMIRLNRNRSTSTRFEAQRDADIRSGANPDEELMKRVSAGATGVWTGEEDENPMEKDPAERARALMGIPRHRREF